MLRGIGLNFQSVNVPDTTVVRTEYPRSDDPFLIFLISRIVSTTGRTQLEFESWLSRSGALIAFRKPATQSYSLP
jgi:hypothetical protein